MMPRKEGKEMGKGFTKIVKMALFIALFSLPFWPIPSSAQLQEAVMGRAFAVKQGGACWEVTPLAENKDAVSFYNYYNFEAHTGLERPDQSLLFLYRDMISKEVSLFVIHDAPGSGSGGKVIFSFQDLPLEATLMLKDDVANFFVPDTYLFNPPQAQAIWNWTGDHTDGLVISRLRTDELGVKIIPEFIRGIDKWNLLSVDRGIVNYIELDKGQPIIITINEPPVADFTYSPSRPELHMPVVFDASPSYDPDGEIVRYEWDFGDGVREVKKTPVHIYEEPGIHKVTLKVTDNCGRSTTIRKIVKPIEVSASRRIVIFPSFEMVPEIPFKVEVIMGINLDLNALGLREDLPKGWRVEKIEISPPEAKAKDPIKIVQVDGAPRIEGFWKDLKAGDTITVTYWVRIPSDYPKIDGDAVFIKGDVEGFAPRFEYPVAGDSKVRVVSTLSIEVVLSSLEPLEKDDPNTNKDLNVDPYCVEWVKDKVECYLITPEPPFTIDEWEVQQAEKFWQYEKPVPLTGGKIVDLKMLLRLYSYYGLQLSVIESLPKNDDG
jgi:PKD repeat protein